LKVHNIYSDILLSLSYYLNKVLEGRIKAFQYNISSTSFNLDYEANYELPAAIITYTNSSYLNARPSTFLRTFSNYNQIPVLFDSTKNIGLKIQEDHFNITVDVAINCDSQFQAIDFKHQFESLIPLNKYLQIYKFVSYFQIDSEYLNSFLFDVSKDKIENIFLKHNELTNELNYYFSVGYEPLIRLTGVNINIGEVSASTFSLNLSFELLMQLPSKVIFDYGSKQQAEAKFDDIKFLKFDNVIVPCNEEYDYIELKVKQDNNNIPLMIHCPCVKDLEKYTLNGDFTNNLLSISINTDTLETTYTAYVYGFIEDKVIEKSTIKFQTGKLGGKYGHISGDKISGKLKSIEISEDNLFSAWFEGEFYGKISSFKINQLAYEYISDYFNIKHPTTVISEGFKILNYRFVDTGSIFSAIRNINTFKNEVDFNLTKITGISFYNTLEKKYTDLIPLPTPVSINKDGSFSFDLLGSIVVAGSINGVTSRISLSAVQTLTLELSHLKIHELKLDVVFKYFPIRGPGRIEQISIDFNLTNQSISNISPTEIPNYSTDKCNIVLDKLNISEKDASNRYAITIPLPLYSNSIPTKFNFFFTKQSYTTDESKLELILDSSLSTTSNLVFTTTEQFYFRYLTDVSKIYPIFFSTSIIR
jgi:hypothetical protein